MHRYIYNNCVEAVTKLAPIEVFDGFPKEGDDARRFHINRINLRYYIVRPNSKLHKDELFLKDTYYDSRDAAVLEFTTAWNSQSTKFVNGQIDKFNMDYKKKKANKDYFRASNKVLNLKTRNLFKRKGSSKFKIPHRCIKQLDKINQLRDFIIQKQCNKYFLLLPANPKIETYENRMPVVSLDPGIKTFQTIYSDEICGEIGKDYITKEITPINIRIDNLEKQKKDKKYRTRKNIEKRILSLRAKVTNKVRYFHKLTAKFLVSNFETIIIPRFNGKRVAENNKKNKKLNRDIFNMAHFAFRTYLKHKGVVAGCNVIECSEAFTTKTCGKCGYHNNVGKRREYKCVCCGTFMDRDLNAARNVLLRSLSRPGLDGSH